MSENRMNEWSKENAASTTSAGPIDDGMKIDGLQQVIDLLRYADPAFRESLLRRLTARDPKLASGLRKLLT